MMRSRRCLLRLSLAAVAVGAIARLQPHGVLAAPDIPGKLLFVRDGSVWQWSHGSETELVVDGAASDPRWSPDGRRVLYVRSGNSYSDLILFDLDSGSATQLTFNRPDYQEGTPEYALTSAWAINPDWSPVGLIAYLSDLSGDEGTDRVFQLWLTDGAPGGGYLAPSAQFEDNIESLSLGPDGSIAAYTVQAREEDGTSGTLPVLRDLADGIAYPLLDGETAFDPAIAPDGQHIAVVMRSRSGTSDLWLLDRASAERVRLTTDLQATNPFWCPDGRWLGFLRMVDFRFEVWVLPMNGITPGAPEALFSAPGLDAMSGLAWSLAEPQPAAVAGALSARPTSSS